MQRILFSLFFLCSALFTQAESPSNLDSIEVIIKQSPSLIENFNDSILLNIKSVEKDYLFVVSNHQRGNYIVVDSLINRALKNYDFRSDSMLLMKYLRALGDMQKITDQFELSIETYRTIIAYFERNEDLLKYAKAKVDLAELYRTIENYNLGLYTLNEAYSEISHLNSSEAEIIKATIYHRKAAIYTEKSAPPDSIVLYSNKAISLGKKLNNLEVLGTSYNELGFLYLTLNPDDPKPIAMEYFRKSIAIWDTLGYKINSLNTILNLSRYYNRKGKFKEGIALLIRYEDSFTSLDLGYELGRYYEMLSRLYGGMKDFRNGYKFSDKSKEYLIKAQRVKYNERLALSNLQIELANKQTEISAIKFETIAKKKENTLLYATLVGFIVIGCVLILLLIYANKQKNKLRDQQSQIIEINKELTDVIEEKQSLLQEVNHRVKNNLSILSSLLYLQQKKVTNPAVKAAVKDSLLRINTISLVHESLYQRDDMSGVNFDEYVNKLINYNKNIYWKDKPLEVNINCKGLKPDLSTSVPLAMILNEMTTNSLKYAFDEVSHPRIDLSYVQNIITYADNGPGKNKTEGNESLGTKLISIFSKQIRATVTHEIDEKGFRYFIHLNNL